MMVMLHVVVVLHMSALGGREKCGKKGWLQICPTPGYLTRE